MNGIKAIPEFLRRSIPRVRLRLKAECGTGDLANIAVAVLFLIGLVSIGSLLTANIEFRSGVGVGWKVADLNPGQGAVVKRKGVNHASFNLPFWTFAPLTVD